MNNFDITLIRNQLYRKKKEDIAGHRQLWRQTASVGDWVFRVTNLRRVPDVSSARFDGTLPIWPNDDVFGRSFLTAY